ncbi:MAG: DUF4160 domain-containing protein [Candidatus Sericytochromatia bacterium]|nr:DUF4160 domain-containing protein [Candidatus Sericytochromatia bacterium]
MPEIFREQGFRFFVFPNDHGPPHVHVVKDGFAVVLMLGGTSTQPRVLRNARMPDHWARQALKILGRRQDEALRAWEAIHD